MTGTGEKTEEVGKGEVMALVSHLRRLFLFFNDVNYKMFKLNYQECLLYPCPFKKI